MSTLAILGAGGHGKVVADAAEATGQWRRIIFFDRVWPEVTSLTPWSVGGDEARLLEEARTFAGVVVAIGDNDVRLEAQRRLHAAGAELATVIHPRAIVSPYARVAPGTVIFAAAVVNANADIGSACIINTAATVDHDCVIEEGVHISPGAHLGGGVHLGAGCWVGIGASLRHNIRIGPGAIVGAGAAVVRSQPGAVTLLGVPARISHRSQHAR